MVIINQELRDVTVKDINQLHYILNIPHYFKNTTVPVGESKQPVVFFKYIFDKLKMMPLHNAELLRAFIINDLGIPLFPEKLVTLPIYTQWTMLSYFLQMCSPICLSPIEGGHRTLQMIKFFTGADFTNKSPQKINPGPREGYANVELRPYMNINESGLAMTAYNYTFWQRFDKTAQLDRQAAGELQMQSDWFKKVLSVSCKDTNDHFLVQVLQKLDAFYAREYEEEFTTTTFFKSHDKSYEILDARMKKAYPVILDCIKNENPSKKVWEKLKVNKQKEYESAHPPKQAFPSLLQLHKSFVSDIIF